MLPVLCAHIAEDLLDLYAIGRVPESQTAEIEEHLLVCPSCSERLSETDRFIAAFRGASAVLDERKAPRKPAASSWTRLRYAPVFTLVAAAALVFALTPERHKPARAAEAVLVAVRGAGSVQIPEAQSTTLDLDVTATTAADAWNVSVVNYRGAVVWKATSRSSGGIARMRIDRQLVRGTYWVRLYDSAAPAELVREYGFIVR